MSDVTVQELMEAGVHYGHQTSRWNPKMKPYIYGARNGIYIININKTAALLKFALDFVEKTVANGEEIMFVGTKKQAQEIITQAAEKCGMHSITYRWLGGTLTNYSTIRSSVERMKKLERMATDGGFEKLHKKEILVYKKELEKLQKSLTGIKNMNRLPGAIFIIDPMKEKIAAYEAKKLGIPILGIVDTNCDPDCIDFIIPGNDDAIRSIQLITDKVTEAVISGKETYSKKVSANKEESSAKYGEKPVVDKEDTDNPPVVLKRKQSTTEQKDAEY